MLISAEAWERVVAHLRHVRSWVCRRGPYLDRDDAEEALTWALIKVSAMEPQPDDFLLYLRNEMKWALAGMRRRRNRRYKLLKKHVKPRESDVDICADLLLDLSLEHQDVIIHYYLRGETIIQIARDRRAAQKTIRRLLNEAEEILHAQGFGNDRGAAVSLGRWRASSRRRRTRASANGCEGDGAGEGRCGPQADRGCAGQADQGSPGSEAAGAAASSADGVHTRSRTGS